MKPEAGSEMSKHGEEQKSFNRQSGQTSPHLVIEEAEPLLIAYCLDSGAPMRLVPAWSSRTWMDETRGRYAYRCLPLLIANQAGWFVLNTHSLRVTWTGGDDISSLQIEYLSGPLPYPAGSHFGHGILTWHLPYLFRTSPGYNLLVRGPANWPKDGASALEGIVESDWSVATFTMNWKLTRPNLPVIFDRDEPICMIVPQQRSELETFHPEVRDIALETEIERGYRQWSQDRQKFLTELKIPESEAVKRGWQKDYFRGLSPDGSHAPEHQLKLNLQDFNQLDGGSSP